MMKNKVKLLTKSKIVKLIIALFVTIVYCIVSNKYIQPKVFLIKTDAAKNSLFRLNIIFTGLIFLFFYFIITFIQKLKQKDKFYKAWFISFCIYFLIMLVFLFLIWPGHWVWDEFNILHHAKMLNENTWQSYITIIYMSVCLMAFPSPISIVIIQTLLISIIISYIFTKILKIYKNRFINIILFVFMLFPSIIINNLYPLRITMYAYVMLIFFATIVFDFKEKRDLTLKKLISFILINILLMVWRSEGIIFAIVQPILIIATYKNLNKKGLIALGLIIVNLIVIKVYNNYYGDSSYYSLTIYMNPLSELLQKDLKGNEINQDLENIDKVLDIEILKKYHSYLDIDCLWEGEQLIRDNWKDNVSAFKGSYLRISLNNWQEFLKVRTKTFLATSCDYNEVPAHIENRFIKYLLDSNEAKPTISEFLEKYKYTNPINKDVKIKTERFLIGDFPTSSILLTILRKCFILIFWNVLPIIVLQTILLFVSFIKKKYIFTLISLTLLGSSMIIFLTAPANFFMYYFPMYLCGTIMSILLIAQLNSEKKLKIKNNVYNNGRRL